MLQLKEQLLLQRKYKPLLQAREHQRKLLPKSIQLIAHSELTTTYDRDQSGSQESVSQEDDKKPSTLDLDLHLSESEYIPTSP